MKPNLSYCKNKRVCVALSGGADSMALFYYLLKNRSKYKITLSAVNCEHGIRGEDSLRDSAFVLDYCKKHDIPCFSYSEDCLALAKKEKLSVETAARAFRYRCYGIILKNGFADVIATAHHANDNAETALINVCRGSSLSGASGILPHRDGFVRPLLHVSKQEIVRYVEENSIPFVEDHTNFCADYTRNHVRLNVIPQLEKVYPDAIAGINRFCSIAREDDELLYQLAAPLVQLDETTATVRCSDKKPLFRRACMIVFKHFGIVKDYTLVHLDSVFELQSLENGKKISLPERLVAFREYEKIVFQREIPSEDTTHPLSNVFTGIRVGDYYVKAEPTDCIERGAFDLAKLPPSCVVRTRNEGDTFRRFGGYRKNLGDYFTDRKIPLRERDRIPVIADGSEIYAVCGVEIADSIKVTDETRTLYKIVTRKL